MNRLTTRPSALAALILGTFAVVGCQQKMAEMPAPRPFEQDDFFEHKQSARPLQAGVVHRNRAVTGDPLVTWLTEAGRTPQVTPEWKAAVDPNGTTAPTAGAPTDVGNFVNEFPFEIAAADLVRGQSMYNGVCAECHGGAGYGNGKIVERGYLKPPSYHTDPAGKLKDSGHLVGDQVKALDVGHSRGFDRYGKKVAIKNVPVGYIYQVITWGYAGMGSHATQVPDPADRWRIIAYIRALQLSQNVPVAELPAMNQAELQKAGAK